MRRRYLLLFAGLLLAPALPASALGGYSPPQRLSSCKAAADVVAVGDTSLWGVLSCAGSMRLVHRTPAGRWSSRSLPYRGFPRAVADDGRTTFLLYTPPDDPSGTPLLIAKVPHGGAPSAARVLDSSSEEVQTASLVAREGKWWAVWDHTFYSAERTEAFVTVHQARSIEPAFAPRRVDLGSRAVRNPRLALRGDGAVLGLSRSQQADGYGTPQPVLAVAGRDGTFVERDLGVATPDGGSVQDLVVSGGRSAIVLSAGGRTVLAVDDLALRFTTRQVPTRAEPRRLSLAASGGRLFVGHFECFTSSAGRFTCRSYVAEGGVTGPLTTTEVSAPFGRKDAGVDVDDLIVTAARGRATAVTTVGQGVWAQTQS